MLEGNPIIGTAGWAASIWLAIIILFSSALPYSAFAAEPAAASAALAPGGAAASPKVHELATLLAEKWLKEQGVAKSAPAPPQQTLNSVADYVNSDFGAIHDQIIALIGAIPDLPNEFERAAARITAIDPDAGRGQAFLNLGIFGDRYRVATRRLAAEAQDLLNLAIFGTFGFVAQWLFRKMTGRVRGRLNGLPKETVNDRLHVIAARFALAFGVIGAFALGSFGFLLALDMDPTRRDALGLSGRFCRRLGRARHRQFAVGSQ